MELLGCSTVFVFVGFVASRSGPKPGLGLTRVTLWGDPSHDRGGGFGLYRDKMTSYLDKVEIYLDKVEIYLDKVKIKPWIVTYSCSILTRLRCAPSPIVTQRTPRIQIQHQFQRDFLGSRASALGCACLALLADSFF